MDTIRVGIVGCGVMGPMHAQAVAELPLTDLVAVADLIPERAQKVAQDFDAAIVYREGADLVTNPPLDLGILALPACHRTQLALAAFAHGKHVLTEKPVAMNAAEVEQMIAARGNLKAACCSSRYRFRPGAEAATNFVASGALGTLRAVHHRNFIAAGPPPMHTPPEWRLKRALNGGGFMMNWGCYDMDYLLGICGWSLRPRTVFAQSWTVPAQLAPNLPEGSDAETQYTALIRCDGGTVLSFERGEYMPIAVENCWQIIGERGSLRLDMLGTERKQIVFDECTAGGGTQSQVLWEGDEDAGEGMRGPLRDLAEAIRDDREPSTSLERSLVIQKITDAVYHSAATGQAVQID